MFGDFSTSIFSTAPTRPSVSPSSPIGPVGLSQRTQNTPPNGTSLFTGATAFNVSAPFHTSAANTQTATPPHEHSSLSLSGNGLSRGTGFQVNQPNMDPFRPADVTALFSGAGSLAQPSGQRPSAAVLLQEAILKGHTGSLGHMPGNAYVPLSGAESPIAEYRGQPLQRTPVDMNVAQGAGRDRGNRLRSAKDGSTQSLPMQDDAHMLLGGFRNDMRMEAQALPNAHQRAASLGAVPASCLRKPRAAGLSRDLVKRQTTKSEAQELLTRTVHMRCLPPSLSQAQLAKFLNDCGPFDRVRVCTNGRANQKWVYGFVEFTQTHGAEALLSRTGYQMGADTDGKPLWIKCIRAAQPIQDLLPSDADTAHGRPCRFGLDERASQSIASLAATPAGALWEQAKATMSPGSLAMGERHPSDDAVSSAEDVWEPSDHSLHTPHLFKDDFTTTTTNAVNHHALGSHTNSTPALLQSQSSDAQNGGWTATTGTVNTSARVNAGDQGGRPAMVQTAARDGTFAAALTLPSVDGTMAVWAALQQLATPGLLVCADLGEAVAKLESEFYAMLVVSARCASGVNEDPLLVSKGVAHCLDGWAALQTFMTTHELLLSALPFDVPETGARGGRRGLPLFVCRTTAYVLSATLALRALEPSRPALRAAVRDLLTCVTTYFPTPSTVLARAAPGGGPRRAKLHTSAASDVFQWVLNLLAVLLSLLTGDAVAVERESVATVLAVYLSCSHAETRLFRELGNDLYNLKVEQLSNMLSHVLTNNNPRTPQQTLFTLAELVANGNAGTPLGTVLVRHFPLTLQVL